MDVTIRPARPDDAALLAYCMLASGRSHMKVGIWDLIISQPEDTCLEFLKMLALQGPRHMCRYTEFTVAEVDGQPVAALEGFDPVANGEETVAEPMAAVIRKMGLTEEDMAPGQQALAAFMTCHSDFMEGAWVIEQVATLPEYRRLGVITGLLDAVLDQGRDNGFGLAQVSFYIGNTPAQRAYEKAGFRVIDEKRHPDFERVIGCPGMMRMLRDL